MSHELECGGLAGPRDGALCKIIAPCIKHLVNKVHAQLYE